MNNLVRSIKTIKHNQTKENNSEMLTRKITPFQFIFSCIVIIGAALSPFYAAPVTYAASIPQESRDNDAAKEDDSAKETEESPDDDPKKPDAENNAFTDSQGVTYRLDEDSCYVSGYTKDIQSSISIPDQLETEDGFYQVKGIQTQAFSKCGKLKKIELPNSVSKIEKGVFDECYSLTSISILPVKYSLRKNGKKSFVGIRINSALIEVSDRVKLKIHKSLVTKAAAQKDTDTILFSIQAIYGGARRALLERIVFDKYAAKALSKSKKTLKVKLVDTDGETSYITISPGSLKRQKDAWELKLQKRNAPDTSGNLKSDLKKALKKNHISEKKAFVYQTTFKGAGTGAEIFVPLKNNKAMKAKSFVYVYRYSKSKRDFLSVFYHPALVSSQGNLRLFLNQGGVYVLSAKPFQQMTRKLVSTFITEAGKSYYIDKNGQTVRGWKKIGQSYYYFDRETGKMASDCTIDSIPLTKGGQAAANANFAKIQTMIKARNIVLQVTDPDDTLEQKIKKCFLWVFQFPYRQYRKLGPIYRQDGWEVTFANDIFDRRQGCCVSEASATAFLFHECGCKTVYVATDTGHAWVERNGRVYDPLFAEARGFDRYYNRPYAGYGMYAVVKHKI